MDSDELKDQLGKSKKMLIALGGVVLFAVYMLWPSASAPVAVTSDLDAELLALQESRASGGGAGHFIDSSFNGTDKRGIELGVGGDSGEGNASVYETGTPDISGILVGYGTQTDSRGEYLVAYVKDIEQGLGYEVDLRDVQRYELRPPSRWEIDTTVYVFGEKEDYNRYRARSIR